jgi:hypothetical protein
MGAEDGELRWGTVRAHVGVRVVVDAAAAEGSGELESWAVGGGGGLWRVWARGLGLSDPRGAGHMTSSTLVGSCFWACRPIISEAACGAV